MTKLMPQEDEWVEVPQALFASWSDARQTEYCVRRDLHTATHSDYIEPMGAEWYIQRATAYNEELKVLVTQPLE